MHKRRPSQSGKGWIGTIVFVFVAAVVLTKWPQLLAPLKGLSSSAPSGGSPRLKVTHLQCSGTETASEVTGVVQNLSEDPLSLEVSVKLLSEKNGYRPVFGSARVPALKRRDSTSFTVSFTIGPPIYDHCRITEIRDSDGRSVAFTGEDYR